MLELLSLDPPSNLGSRIPRLPVDHFEDIGAMVASGWLPTEE